MRAISAVLAIGLIAACDRTDDPAADSETGPGAAAGEERIACAPAGAERFEPVCTVERAAGDEGPILTLRAPDGSFRRLRVTQDGSGLAAADGAEPAHVTPVGESLIEVAIGTDRYRLPATIRSGPG